MTSSNSNSGNNFSFQTFSSLWREHRCSVRLTRTSYPQIRPAFNLSKLDNSPKLKIKKQAESVLKFLNGTNANVVMESGYNYQYLYDLLKAACNISYIDIIAAV